MTKDFYIFRHGQSTYNLEGRTQGQTNDSVLTELGKTQALAIGQKLQNKGIEIIVSSPLKRALQTTELANKSLRVPTTIDKQFIEVNVGVVEGMHYTEIMAKYGDIFQKIHSPGSEHDHACYPEGETKSEVRARVFAGLNQWADNAKYQTIAISSHGIMLSQILTSLGQPSSDVKNGAILHIRKENNHWSIIEWI